MTQYIYADNAATTAIDEEAYQKMKEYIKKEYGNASQPYSFSREAKKVLQEARLTIATCINAEPEEIYFTSGGSESDNWAIKGVMLPADKGKNEIITSNIEHHAVLNTCNEIIKHGCNIVEVPVDRFGIVDIEQIKRAISEKTKMISIMLVNNEIGTVEPVQEIVAIAHRNKIDVHTDAVQAIGHMLIDVKELGVDYMSASAHKFNGPKGVGFLYIKKGKHIASLINGGKQEFGLRAGTENIAGIVGMSVALKNNCLKIQSNSDYISSLEKELLNVLFSKEIDFIRNGRNQIPGNISLSFAEVEGEMLLHRLDLKKILVSTGSACDSQTTQLSHVIKAIGVDSKYAKGTIRISLGKNNTIEEVRIIAETIAKIMKEKF